MCNLKNKLTVSLSSLAVSLPSLGLDISDISDSAGGAGIPNAAELRVLPFLLVGFILTTRPDFDCCLPVVYEQNIFRPQYLLSWGKSRFRETFWHKYIELQNSNLYVEWIVLSRLI